MTDHRDFKRRVRNRQARTGESYMTARRQVLARRETAAIPVVEAIDAGDEAARLGFRCRILIFPRLAARIDQTLVLERFRDALLITEGDPATERLRALAFRGLPPPLPKRWSGDLATGIRRLVSRARAGIGGTTREGSVLAMHMTGRDGLVVVVLATAWHVIAGREPTIVLGTVDEDGAELWEDLP